MTTLGTIAFAHEHLNSTELLIKHIQVTNPMPNTTWLFRVTKKIIKILKQD